MHRDRRRYPSGADRRRVAEAARLVLGWFMHEPDVRAVDGAGGARGYLAVRISGVRAPRRFLVFLDRLHRGRGWHEREGRFVALRALEVMRGRGCYLSSSRPWP